MKTENQIAIEVAGRKFFPAANTTFEQDFFVMEKVRAAGISQIPRDPDPSKLSEAAQEILVQAFKSGVLFDLLAGILVEENVPWGQDSALLNSDFFRQLYDPKDKESLYSAMAGVILSFFIDEGRSSLTSRKSSVSRRPSPSRRKQRPSDVPRKRPGEPSI